MKYVFVGGVTPKLSYIKEIRGAKSPLQNAAENFQMAFISGLSETISVSASTTIDVVSAPFFGSWPQNNRCLWIGGRSAELSPKVHISGAAFLNLPVIKNVFKYFGLKSLISKSLDGHLENVVIFVYSLDLSYLAAVASCANLKRRGGDIRTVAVVTDLPDFPGDCSKLYRWYLKYFEKPIVLRLVSSIDNFIVLTEKIPAALKVEASKCVVLEGLYDPGNASLTHESKPQTKNDNLVVMYSGTLDERYGISRLLDAFNDLAERPIELWVCGGGSASNLVLDAATRNKKVRFFGLVDRAQVLRMQTQADLLVNPRDNVGEYNKYSFPSKLMEYMASGVPTLGFALDGIPVEYYNFLYIVDSGAGEKLSAAISRVLSLSADDRKEKGKQARNFILSNKTAGIQVGRAMKFLGF